MKLFSAAIVVGLPSPARRVSALILLSGLCGIPLPGVEPLLLDDFNGPGIDPGIWKVSLPFSYSSATVSNGALELFRRGVLSAVPPFDDALDIQGRFRFTGDNDTFSIVFRSDLTVANLAERRGVQAALQETGGRVLLIPEPFVSTPIPAAFNIGKNRDISFRIVDQDNTVRLYVEDLFSPVITATITNRRGNHVCLYNFYDTPCRTRLDSFSIYALQTSVFLDGALVREGPISRTAAVQTRFQAFFTNSTIYYTLDGSPPSFTSIEYQGPFALDHSAILRAIAYRSDFLASSESPAITVEVLPQVTLTDATPGGGAIVASPAGGIYPSNTVVTLTALAAPGWQFLRWEGALDGTAATNQLTLTNHLTVQAVFATAPALTTIGSGQILTAPLGPAFPYGTRVRFLAVPAVGNYFFRWANAVTGSQSPATLEITNATPGISALFSGLNGGQVSLVTLLDGAGTIAIAPAANLFTNGQTIHLAALPDPDQVFLGWESDLSGLENPATLLMDANKTVTARFAPGVRFLRVPEAFGTNGFALLMKGAPGFSFELQSSPDLVTWDKVEALTNLAGALRYQDSAATNQPWLFYRVVAPKPSL